MPREAALADAGVAFSSTTDRRLPMPRYLVERTFPGGLDLPPTAAGAEVCRTVIRHNAEDQVTWVHSYVSTDRTKTFCIYDAPDPEAVRRTASRNGLPVERVTEVRVLDPYFHF
jgi:hypothetical protein